MADDKSSDEDVEEDLYNSGPCVFDCNGLAFIRSCMKGVILPTYICHPPTDIGKKSHGKLTANNCFVLYTMFLMMCLPELWGLSTDQHKQLLLDNFFNLVICTNIVDCFVTTNALADSFLMHYIAYRRPLKRLFPHDHIVPNHHYAIHIPQMLKFWGLLPASSKYHMNTIMEPFKGLRLMVIWVCSSLHTICYSPLIPSCG
jgi:hypothetical protein